MAPATWPILLMAVAPPSVPKLDVVVPFHIVPVKEPFMFSLVPTTIPAVLIPYPSKKTLGERLGLSPRQVQRYVAELEEAGLVKRLDRFAAHKGRLSNQYDLSGLVARLKKMEPEFREVNAMKRQVARPGGLRSRRQVE